MATVIPGARSRAEVERNVALWRHPISDGLWTDLRAQRLLHPAVPSSRSAQA